MKNLKIKNKRLYFIIIIGIILVSCELLAILVFNVSNYFYYKNNENEVNDKVDTDSKDDSNSNDEIDNDKDDNESGNNSNENLRGDETEDELPAKEYNGKFKNNVDSYVLDITGYEDHSAVYYKLSDKLTIKLVFDFLGDEKYFNIYINDKYLLKDANHLADEVTFKKVGNDLVYLNTDVTDIRGGSVYIINKNIEITDIYELDKISGMVPHGETINNDSIVIKGSRMGHGTICYGDICEYVSKDTILSDIGLTGNEIVEATYTYKLKEGILDLNPTVSNEVTLSEYLNSLKY